MRISESPRDLRVPLSKQQNMKKSIPSKSNFTSRNINLEVYFNLNTGLDRRKVDPNDKYLAFEHFNILHAEHMRSKSHRTATKHLPPILVHIM